MKLMKRTVLFILIIQLFFVSGYGYTATNGIQDGDIATIDYIGEFKNGTVFDEKQETDLKVTNETLIEGFYENLLGMKIGENKQFTVPPEKGYQDPDHRLHGETLIFDVHVDDVRTPEQSTENNQDNTTQLILNDPITPILLISFFAIGILSKKTIKNC